MPPVAQVLRVLLMRRSAYIRLRTRTVNSINNILLRFGHTLCANAAVMRAEVRSLIEDIASNKGLPDAPGVAPLPTPPQ